MSKLNDRRYRQDVYHQRAKKEDYAARSVYKLQEIDRRFRLFKSGQRVLDLGCRPGSWLQFVAEKVSPKGFVVGLDREALSISLPSNAAVLIGDVLTIDPKILREALPPDKRSCFQVIISDMAPDTSGVPFTDQVRSAELFLRALDLALLLGCPASHFLGKLFMGESYNDTLKTLRSHYRSVKTVIPEATRKSSTEVYLVAMERIHSAPASS